jgi:hypothetical protein
VFSLARNYALITAGIGLAVIFTASVLKKPSARDFQEPESPESDKPVPDNEPDSTENQLDAASDQETPRIEAEPDQELVQETEFEDQDENQD